QCLATNSRRYSPACATPPPKIILDGFNMFTICEQPKPRYSPNCSTTCLANTSCCSEASKISLALSSSPLSIRCLILESPLYSSEYSRVRFINPVAEANASKQPTFPQVHAIPLSLSIVMWPISPAAPELPWTILLSTIIPPPTPVPKVTITTSEALSPDP